MNISKEGIMEIASYEALSHTKYLDSANVETIGIGMTTTEIPNLNSWSWEEELTAEQCVDEFVQHLEQYVQGVENALKVRVTQYQSDALVSIAYNVGVFGAAKSTFMKLINKGADVSSICNAIKVWDRAGGRMVQGLLNRRINECKLFSTGKYSNNGTCALINVDPATHKPHYTVGYNSSIVLAPYIK